MCTVQHLRVWCVCWACVCAHDCAWELISRQPAAVVSAFFLLASNVVYFIFSYCTVIIIINIRLIVMTWVCLCDHWRQLYLMANIVIASGVYICTGRWSARATRCDSSAQSGFICLLLLLQYCAFFPLSVSFSSSLLMLAIIYESLISGDVCSPMMWDALSDCPGRNI